MVDFGNAKIFGGIGALLSFIGIFIPSVGFVVSIVGLILLFMAVKTISDITKDHDIFKNYLMHFVLSIITIVVVIAIFIIAFGLSGGLTWITEIQSIESTGITDFGAFWDHFEFMIYGCIAAAVIGWILLIISSLYLKKSYKAIAKHTGVHLFDTTGLVYFIGAITTIILIGFLIIIIAKIIEIVAYFSLPDKLPTGEAKEKS